MKNKLPVSIIIAIGKSASYEIYKKIIATNKLFEGIECVWVSSNTEVSKFLNSHDQTVVDVEDVCRAAKYNIGFQHVSGQYIVFQHPRSVLSKEAIQEIIDFAREKKINFWGGFTHRFLESSHPFARFTSWYSNNVRSDLFKIVYLDHCIFACRQLFEKVKEFPEADIFEDTLFSRSLNKSGKYKRFNGFSDTSFVRFQKNGMFYQGLLNQIAKVMFLCGANAKTINKMYERGLWLN